MTTFSPVSDTFRRSKLLNYLFFLVIIFCAYFLKFRSFGLYEDDYWYIGKPVNQDFHGLLQLLAYNLTNIEGGQGRFIGMTVPQFLAFISYKLGGLSGVYLLGIVIVVINSILIFNFSLKILPKWVATLSAILYILYPADTTKPLLIHIYQLQLSLCFTLIALNLYLSGRKFWSFVLAFCSLLTYENAFLLFLTVPLFALDWDKRIIKRWIVHLLICFSFLIVLFMLRKMMGESRVEGLNPVKMVKRTLGSVVIGPIFSLYAIIEAIKNVVFSLSMLKWMIVLGLVLFSIWMYAIRGTEPSENNLKPRSVLLPFIQPSDPEIGRIFSLILASGLMLMSSYLLAFTHFPPTSLHGRNTSVHLASSIAGSIFIAVMIYYVFYLLRQKKLALNIVRVSLVVLLSILFSRGYIIQHDFAESWKAQKNFWKQVVHSTPDASDNTIIIADVKNMRTDLQNITTFYNWPIPDIYGQLVEFDSTWKSYPKVAIPGATYTTGLKSDSSGVYFEPVYSFLFEDREKVYLQDSNTVYLNYIDNSLSRIDTVLRVGNFGIHTNLSTMDNTPFVLKEVGKLMLKD